MSWNKIVRVIAALLPLMVLPAFVTAPAALVQQCAGTGLSGNDNWIKCDGECGASETCRVGRSTDAKGAYKFCGCGGDSGGPSEPSCCHLVARKVNNVVVLDVRGLCTNNNPDCSDADGLTCHLVNDQPVCQP
jgi:hypothetical protein